MQKNKIGTLNIFHSINDFHVPSGKTIKKTILTLGTFDGVHFGHKKILEKSQTKNQAKTSKSQNSSKAQPLPLKGLIPGMAVHYAESIEKSVIAATL